MKPGYRYTANETTIMIIRSDIALLKFAIPLTGLIFLAGVILVLPTKATATNDSALKQQQDRQTQIDKYKKRQKNLQLEINKGRQEVKTFSRKESDTIKRLNRIEQSLNKSRKRAAGLAKEIKSIDEKISVALKTSEKLKQRIQVE